MPMRTRFLTTDESAAASTAVGGPIETLDFVHLPLPHLTPPNCSTFSSNFLQVFNAIPVFGISRENDKLPIDDSLSILLSDVLPHFVDSADSEELSVDRNRENFEEKDGAIPGYKDGDELIFVHFEIPEMDVSLLPSKSAVHSQIEPLDVFSEVPVAEYSKDLLNSGFVLHDLDEIQKLLYSVDDVPVDFLIEQKADLLGDADILLKTGAENVPMFGESMSSDRSDSAAANTSTAIQQKMNEKLHKQIDLGSASSQEGCKSKLEGCKEIWVQHHPSRAPKPKNGTPSKLLGRKDALVQYMRCIHDRGDINWFLEDCLLPDVKDQDETFLCWAFVVTEALYAMWRLSGGERIHLDMQFLINCVRIWRIDHGEVITYDKLGYGCSQLDAFQFIQEIGIPVAENYPIVRFCEDITSIPLHKIPQRRMKIKLHEGREDNHCKLLDRTDMDHL